MIVAKQAVELIASVRAAGGTIRRDGDTIELAAPAPLATDLGLKVRTDFALHQEKDLVSAALGAAAAVLICWHHERIPRLVAQLGIEIEAWPEGVFDRVLVFDHTGNRWILSVVQQHLLPGDS